MISKTFHIQIFFLLWLLIPVESACQYKPVTPRAPARGEIPVNEAGSLDIPGATYILVNDISSPASSVFLGRDVTLDLNGYTIRYADADYRQIPNSGFEKGLEGWDISMAPGARLMNTADVHVFLGEKLLSLEAGDVIRSSYVYLPVANRSYFAMCGITGRYWEDMEKYPDDEMKISIYVEDENGDDVICVTEYRNNTMVSCPVEKKSPRLGGGFIYAHLNNLPAGNYRVRIKAETDCLIDEIDIRPAMDVGIGIVDNTFPFGHYDHLHDGWPNGTFYDYTRNFSNGDPLEGIPVVKGEGTISIKNGVIESAVPGILSWAVQSTAANVKIILENINTRTSGISSGAANLPWASIRNCRFDADMPFLIQRHSNLCNVTIRGENASEVAYSEFYGGQGNLSIRGKYSLVHDNLFKNNQTVTNHYSIMGTGEGSKIFNNRFEPYQGSGIYVSRHTEVFNNVFNIETSPPTCEYGRGRYSTAAIRLGDYHAVPGSPNASEGNRIYGNKINITAIDYPEPKEYIPMVWGVYYSARGGENYIYDNDIIVNNVDLSSKSIASAFYICGGPEYFGGQFFNNRITTNVPAAWIATWYGDASNTRISDNIIVPLDEARFETFRMGSGNYLARNIEFRSNSLTAGDFTISATGRDHSYTVYWRINIRVYNSQGDPVNNEDIKILDKNKDVALYGKTDENGMLSVELPEFEVDGDKRKVSSPYTINAGKITKKVELNRNKEILLFK